MRQVSAVTVHPPSKASSCEPSYGSRNTGVKKTDILVLLVLIDFVLPVLKGPRPYSPQTLLPISLLHPSPLVLVSSTKYNVRLR
jgi:hypothetical protein